MLELKSILLKGVSADIVRWIIFGIFFDMIFYPWTLVSMFLEVQST